jgi:hypothetical protein
LKKSWKKERKKSAVRTNGLNGNGIEKYFKFCEKDANKRDKCFALEKAERKLKQAGRQ